VYNVEPDIMTLAKGLGGGVPIGALLAKERAAVFAPGEHGSTFGGNPLTCAAAVAVVRYLIDQGLSAKALELGEYLIAELNKMKNEFGFVKEIRGRGLLVAIEFGSDIADSVLNGCLIRGLLVNKVKPNALRFIPPLVVTRAELDEGLSILREVLKKWQSGKK